MQDEMPLWSAYSYSFCNPVVFNDPSGMVPEEPSQQQPVQQPLHTFKTPGGEEVIFTERYKAFTTTEAGMFDLQGGDQVLLDEGVLTGFETGSGSYRAAFEREGDAWSFIGYRDQAGSYYEFGEIGAVLEEFTVSAGAPSGEGGGSNTFNDILASTSGERSLGSIITAYGEGAADFVLESHDKTLDLDLSTKDISKVKGIKGALSIAGKALGVTSIIDHGKKSMDAYRKGDKKELALNMGKMTLDAIFMLGKASNPAILFGSIAYTIWDMSGTMQW